MNREMKEVPVRKVSRIHRISDASAHEYEKSVDALVSAVDKRMTRRVEESGLIGPNPLSVMYDNHANHGSLLVNVLKFRDFTLLEQILPWVINSYTSRGFALEYFPIVLDQWKQVIAEHLSAEAAGEILPVYEWMESVIGELYREISQGQIRVIPPHEVMDEARKREVDQFVQLLITGRHIEALQFLRLRVTDGESMKEYYDRLLVPAMYEVGHLWETNRITVAHEHLATSIIMRIITYFYMDIVNSEHTKGKVVVTSSANEYHEVGARIVADFLELDGWDVIFMGANTPSRDLLVLLQEEHPDLLCISVTMANNFSIVQKMIQESRALAELQNMRIMLGGYAFTYSTDSATKMGADALIPSAAACIIKAREWWEEMRYA